MKKQSEGYLKGVTAFSLPIAANSLLVAPNESKAKHGYTESIIGEPRQIHELVSFQQFKPSDVGRYGRKEKNENIRVSEECGARLYTQHPSKANQNASVFINDIIRTPLLDLVPPDLRQFVEQGSVKYHYTDRWRPIQSWTAVRYQTGGFFKKHRDSSHNSEKFASVILMIPAYDPTLEHSGGILRIWDANGELHEYDSSKITEVTVVAFDPHLEHECTPITSGTRIIFKAEWCYEHTAYSLVTTVAKDIVDIGIPGNTDELAVAKLNEIKDGLILKMDSIAKELQDSKGEFDQQDLDTYYNDLRNVLAKIKEIKNQVVYSNTRYDLSKIFAKLDKCKSDGLPFAIVPLFNFYEEIRQGRLYSSDYALADALRERYGRVGIKQLKSKKYESADDMEPLSGSQTPPDFEEISDFADADRDDYETKKVIAEFVDISDYGLSSVDHGVGRTIQHSEYNDSTYDRSYHNLYTCLIVWF